MVCAARTQAGSQHADSAQALRPHLDRAQEELVEEGRAVFFVVEQTDLAGQQQQQAGKARQWLRCSGWQCTGQHVCVRGCELLADQVLLY